MKGNDFVLSRSICSGRHNRKWCATHMNFAAAPLPASLTKQNSWLKSDTIRLKRVLIFRGLIFCRFIFSVQHVQASRSRRVRPWSPGSVRAHVRLHRLQERKVVSSDAPNTEPQPLGRIGSLGVFAKVGIITDFCRRRVTQTLPPLTEIFLANF